MIFVSLDKALKQIEDCSKILEVIEGNEIFGKENGQEIFGAQARIWILEADFVFNKAVNVTCIESMLKEKKSKDYLNKLYNNLEKAYKYFYIKDFPINSTKCMMYKAVIDL